MGAQRHLARISDSVLCGGVALSIASVALAVAWLGTGPPERQDEWLAVAGFTWVIGAPLLALMNLFFVVRDYLRGERLGALLGCGLSMSTLFAAWAPLIIHVVSE